MPIKTFQGSWLSDSSFLEWIARLLKKKMPYCKLCKCVISLSNMGEKALRTMLMAADGMNSHADGMNKLKISLS